MRTLFFGFLVSVIAIIVRPNLALARGGLLATTPRSQAVVTPRGVELTLEIFKIGQDSAKKPVILLAPGQACSQTSELLDAVSRLAQDADFNVIQFQWAYCRNPESQPRLPSPFLVDEIEDLETVLGFAQQSGEFDPERIVLAGKTQGSFVAYRVFVRQPGVLALALLTPVCTYSFDAANRPLPVPIQVGRENYPYLSIQRRPILFVVGDNDKSCLLSGLSELLESTSPNVQSTVVPGDHAFRTYSPDGQAIETETAKNIERAARALTTWLTHLYKIGTSLRE